MTADDSGKSGRPPADSPTAAKSRCGFAPEADRSNSACAANPDHGSSVLDRDETGRYHSVCFEWRYDAN